MAVLNKLAIGTSADGAEVTGTGSNGNDQQLKVLLLAIGNNNKKSPHSMFVETANIYKLLSSGATTAIHRSVTKKVEAGTRLLAVAVELVITANTSTNADNFVTVSMYKTASFDGSEPKDTNAPLGVAGTEAYIIPEQNIRSIKNTDDAGLAGVGKSVVLPVQMDYAATDEYVTFRMSVISTASLGGAQIGWTQANINFWYSSEHEA